MVVISGQEVPLGGDILLSVEGIDMRAANLPKIRDQMNRAQSGQPLKITILRAGQVLELTGQVP